jgi:hypothetical protein
LVTWGIFTAGAFLIAVLIAGLFVGARWLAALCVAILSLVSAVVLIAPRFRTVHLRTMALSATRHRVLLRKWLGRRRRMAPSFTCSACRLTRR